MVDDGVGGDQSYQSGTGESHREETGGNHGGRQPPTAKRRWYHSSLVEPFLGMVLGFLLVVLLAGVFGSPVTAFVRTITGGFGGIGSDSAPIEGRMDGSALFARYCAACHGEQGDRMPSADLTSRSFMSNRSELAIIKIISEGRGAMPSFGRSRGGPLDDKQVRAMAAFVRTLGTTLVRSSSPTPTAPPTPRPATPTPKLASPTPQVQVPTGQPPTATPIRSTPTPVQPTATPKPPTPVPTPRLEGQPPIYDQYVGVVRHVEGWFMKHPSYVKNNGASFCFRCHGASFCTSCHTKQVW